MDFLFEPIWKDFKKLQGKSNVTYKHSIRVADYALGLTDRLVDFIHSDKADSYLVNLFSNMSIDEFRS